MDGLNLVSHVTLGRIEYEMGGFLLLAKCLSPAIRPEMVGTIGGRTAVANNDQIVEGVSEGVYEAVMSAMSKVNRNGQNMSVNVYLDGKQIEASVRKVQRERGAQILTGGVYA